MTSKPLSRSEAIVSTTLTMIDRLINFPSRVDNDALPIFKTMIGLELMLRSLKLLLLFLSKAEDIIERALKGGLE